MEIAAQLASAPNLVEAVDQGPFARPVCLPSAFRPSRVSDCRDKNGLIAAMFRRCACHQAVICAGSRTELATRRMATSFAPESAVRMQVCMQVAEGGPGLNYTWRSCLVVEYFCRASRAVTDPPASL